MIDFSMYLKNEDDIESKERYVLTFLINKYIKCFEKGFCVFLPGFLRAGSRSVR